LISETKNNIKSIGLAIEKQDINTVILLAHGIKGSAGNVCAPILQQSASNLEMAGKNNQNESFNELLTKLTKDFEEIVEKLKMDNIVE